MTLGKINKRKILGLYSPSGVFELKKIYAERHEEFDPCCDEKFADVTYVGLLLISIIPDNISDTIF